MQDQGEAELRHLRFLMSEGLELVAAFKAISDPTKRQEIIALARAAGIREGASPEPSRVVSFSSDLPIDRGRH